MNINKRQSIRKYIKDYQVSDQVIYDILDAAMHAPSARNKRPWFFTVIKNRDILNEISTMSPYMGMMKDASFAIMVYVLEDYDIVLNSYIPQDCGAAIENMLLKAMGQGLGSCWCGIFPNVDRTRIFKNFFKLAGTPIAMIAFGKANEEVKVRGFYDDKKVNYIQ